MYNSSARNYILNILSPIMNVQDNIKDSTLLQFYSLICEMRKVSANEPDIAYQKVITAFSQYSESIYRIRIPIPADSYKTISRELSRLSYLEFLTHVVPSLVCNPQRTMIALQSIKPGMSYIEQTHHIIRIKLIAYKMDGITEKDGHSNTGYDDILDNLYDAYTAQKYNATLKRDEFLRLYSSINTFELSPKALSPKSRGAGFKDKDLEDLMVILTDQLQLTRAQQLDLVAKCFINKMQATDIIPLVQTYNFTCYKDILERKRLVQKAHRLMARIPPLELVCAISTRKKLGSVNTKKGTEALVVPNDVMLETGFIYPTFKSLIGLEKENRILLVSPSAFFIRTLLEDALLRERNITIAIQDDNAAALLRYQVDEKIYATQFDKDNIIPVTTFIRQLEEKRLPYDKVFVFGNNLPVEQQQYLVGNTLNAAENDTDVFALLSTYAIDNVSPLSVERIRLMPYLKTISLIPQGINNSSFPKRKMWVHFNVNVPDENSVVKVYAYTLDTSIKTQAISLLREAPLEIPRSELAQLGQSIRKCYSHEIMSRRAQGRTRAMAFSHEIAPDIPVWCSRSFPHGKEKNPRLEAYVCMPAPDEKVLRGFSARGEVIKSTKKHTTQVPESKVLDWLQNTYPFSSVQQRNNSVKRLDEELQGPQLKTEISIREEIIEYYTPLLEKQNIALKTLWYLYPNLSNKYVASDYQVLTEMMHTVIGQQRVCDVTSELMEQLLIEEYPDLSESALWRNYKILSIAMENAKQYGYCHHNPLEDALQEEKLRRKLFAQVRKQLVKKHLEKSELKMAYHAIVSKIQAGQCEYVGVLIRFLTGLESNIVCALRWCDMVKAPYLDVAYFVITRQVSNNGQELSGFSDTEDYICFPLPAGLRSLLENFRARLHSIPDETRIMDSIIAIEANAPKKAFTPYRLNQLTKSILNEYRADDNYFNVAYGDHEFRKTNLNKYMGNFIRENFRYWATDVARLLPAELSYLLRNRVNSTCGRFYCDFQNEASLAIIATKLSRLECLFMQGTPPITQRESSSNVQEFVGVLNSNNGYRQKVSIEIIGNSSVEVYVHSPRGIQSSASIIVDKEGKPI